MAMRGCFGKPHHAKILILEDAIDVMSTTGYNF